VSNELIIVRPLVFSKNIRSHSNLARAPYFP
jgi:hypothetical protein